MSIAYRLRSLREVANLSMDELARIAGISKTYLWELEKDTDGVKHVSLDIATRLANALGVPIGDLAGQPSSDRPADLRTVRIAMEVLNHLESSERVYASELAAVRQTVRAWECRLRSSQDGA